MDQRGYIQGYRKTALLGTFQVPGTTHLHVLLGQVEAVLSRAHQFQPLPGFLADLVAVHQDAIGFLRSPSDTSAQLVELRQTEPFRILYDHYRGIRNIHSHFYDRGRDQDVSPPGGECIHVEFLYIAGLLAVNDSDLIIRHGEAAHDFLVSHLKVLVIELLTLEYKGIYDEYLTPGIDLLPDEVVHRRTLSLPYQHRLYRLPSGRHLINHGNVKVAVESHRKGTRYGGSGHHQDMWRCLHGTL